MSVFEKWRAYPPVYVYLHMLMHSSDSNHSSNVLQYWLNYMFYPCKVKVFSRVMFKNYKIYNYVLDTVCILNFLFFLCPFLLFFLFLRLSGRWVTYLRVPH